ncbi:MAG: chemotaxis protein MotA [Ignavibacteria bacterium CG2_30_36_16]|nr:chemotaxis protein MotA [Ignavibacteria bacterium]OIP56219.1 MAG: chemotaxis protein MotA [Ignavibacteria bacterium CG2_30_36_16]PJA99519.1 MAG: chemotaxis protein MotA [Ignavibacteria bacterium CG_4_9_14_3_um_filter_36_18]
MKKLGAVNGLILGLVSIFGAFMLEGGSFKAIFLLPALVIVFGGTFAATIIGFGFDKFKNIFSLARLAYFPREYNLTFLINSFVNFSIISRKEGLLAIEKDLGTLEYLFPKKLIRYVIDGTDADSLENLAMLEIKAMQQRHFSNIFIFNKMGGYAPTMGIIGTVMGLIMTLANAGGDPSLLIKSIATAFIATLWGVFSANILWLPIGDRLKKCHSEEKHMMEISLEGVLALQSGEIPSIVKARLISMLAQKEQAEILNAPK